MYSDRQEKLKVLLKQLEQSVEGKHGRNSLGDVLQRLGAVYGRYKELERRNFLFDKVKKNIHLRFVYYEKNKGFLEKLVFDQYHDLAAMVTLEEDIEDKIICKFGTLLI